MIPFLVACVVSPADTASTADSAADCTTEVVPSVTVNVSAKDDYNLENLSVHYAVDGEAQGPCNDHGEGIWSCGEDEAGTLTISATADRCVAVTTDVVVTGDECHVQTQTAALELATYCTGEPVPAVVINLTAEEEGGVLENPYCFWHLSGEGGSNTCDYVDNACLCAYDIGGDISFQANADGRGAVATTKTIELDESGCHPITQTFDWDLGMI